MWDATYYTRSPIQIKLEIKRILIRASDFSFLSIRRLSECNSHRARQAGAQTQFGRLGAEKHRNVHVYLYVLQKIIDNCLISCSLHPIRRTSDRLSGHSIKFRDSGPAPHPSTCLPLIHSQSGQSTCLGAHPVSLINSNKMPPQISSSPRAHVRTIIARFPVQ